MADLVFGGNADGAVQLHRLLTNEPAGAADLDFGGGDIARAFGGVFKGQGYGGEQRH